MTETIMQTTAEAAAPRRGDDPPAVTNRFRTPARCDAVSEARGPRAGRRDDPPAASTTSPDRNTPGRSIRAVMAFRTQGRPFCGYHLALSHYPLS